MITKKVRLLPTKEARTKMWQSVTPRFIYNWTLNKQLTNYQNGRKFIQRKKSFQRINAIKKELYILG